MDEKAVRTMQFYAIKIGLNGPPCRFTERSDDPKNLFLAQRPCYKIAAVEGARRGFECTGKEDLARHACLKRKHHACKKFSCRSEFRAPAQRFAVR